MVAAVFSRWKEAAVHDLRSQEPGAVSMGGGRGRHRTAARFRRWQAVGKGRHRQLDTRWKVFHLSRGRRDLGAGLENTGWPFAGAADTRAADLPWAHAQS